MAAKPKANLGKMPCPDCRQPVALMKAETGTLSYKCQEADCEATGFAQAHTAASRKWIAAVTPKPQAAAPATQKPPAKTPVELVPKEPAKEAPQPPQDKPPAKGGFNISEL